jgi:hypothetical protein
MPWKRAGVFINKSCKVVWSHIHVFVANSLVDIMQNVGEHGGCLECVQQDAISRCIHFCRMPYLEDVPCMDMVWKLLNILNRFVEKVYSPMTSLLFVFCELVVLQVWWMKACAFMLQWSWTI